jgi:hypothetical protein
MPRPAPANKPLERPGTTPRHRSNAGQPGRSAPSRLQSQHHIRAIIIILALAATADLVSGFAPIETDDPLKAFVFDQYPRGSDYFINGNRDTTLFRCIADFNRDARPDIALSEKSIWGNRTGPFEIFIQEANGRFRYLRTADYDSDLKPLCGSRLESCSSNDYLSSGKCTWKKGIAR